MTIADVYKVLAQNTKVVIRMRCKTRSNIGIFNGFANEIPLEYFDMLVNTIYPSEYNELYIFV